MKRTTGLLKVISFLLTMVILYQPLIVNATNSTTENNNGQNKIVDSVKLINAANVNGNLREIRITFNTPVRFVDGQPSLHIFAGNFIFADANAKDSWQADLVQDAQGCVAINPVNNNGLTFATSYDLKFANDLKKEGIVKIVDNIKNNVKSSNDAISSVCDMKGNFLVSNNQNNLANIASADYTIFDKMVSVSIPTPNKAIITFNYDTDFIVSNPCDFIYAVDKSNTDSRIFATSFAKIDNKDYSFTFSDNLPANGEIKIEEKVNDGDGFLNSVAQASDGSKLAASITDTNGYDADCLTFVNSWLYVTKAEYINKNEARLYFSDKAKFNTTDITSTVFATEKPDPNSTDGWKVTAKSISPVDGTILLALESAI